MLMVYTSGKATKYLINRYVMDTTSQLQEQKLTVGGLQDPIPKGIYKNPHDLGYEFYTSPELKPEEVRLKSFFGSNRNYFIQVVKEEDELKTHNDLHPHFYQLKRLTRKKSQPLFPYRLNVSTFKEQDAVLRKVFNLSVEELQDISYILINEDKMKLPMHINEEIASISYKFIQNPTKIHDLEELYDAFDVNKYTNVKYFIICNPSHDKPSNMTIQQKMFRKFFYENSSFIDNDARFLEITNHRIAQRIGLEGQDHIVVFQNKNPFSHFKKFDHFKLQNLELEKFSCDNLRQINIEKKYVKYLPEMNFHEFQEFLMSDDRLDETFSLMTDFVEDALISNNNVIFVPTLKSLKFYKNHFRKRMQDVLFIYIQNETQLKEIQQQIAEISDKNLNIILTDLKDGPAAFNFIHNDSQTTCIRYIDYSRIYNEKLNKVVSINDMIKDSKIRAEHEPHTDNLYVLKYTPNLDQGQQLNLNQFINDVKQQKTKPYLEVDNENAKDNSFLEYDIKTINRNNYQQMLKQKDLTLIEVYGSKCHACKQVESILPSLTEHLVKDFKNLQVSRMNALNEVSFLKDIDKTPTFLIYNKKKDQYKRVDMRDENEIQKIEQNEKDLDDQQKLLFYLRDKISKEIKNLQ